MESTVTMNIQWGFGSTTNLFTDDRTKIHFYFQKCWPYTHPSVTRDSREETANPMTKTYFTREEENTMVRVEDNIRERVREHNNNVNR